MSIVRRRNYECVKTWRCEMKVTWVTMTSRHKFWSTIHGANPSSPRGLRLGSAAARLPGLRVRIPPGAWMFVFYECCVLSSRGLCDGPITCPEESYRVWCVWEWWRKFIKEVLAHNGLLYYGRENMVPYYYITVIKQRIIFIK